MIMGDIKRGTEYRGGFPSKWYFLGGPHNKDHCSWGVYITGVSLFGETTIGVPFEP